MLGTANELDTGEEGDATGQQHREAFELHLAVLTAQAGRRVPLPELPALGLVVNMIE